jgi:hypothetical protein
MLRGRSITAGCLLLLSPLVINRIEQLSLGASGLQMQLSKDMAEAAINTSPDIMTGNSRRSLAEKVLGLQPS